jgi:hypothetical protein
MQADRAAVRAAIPAIIRWVLLIVFTFPINPWFHFGQVEKTPSIGFTTTVPATPAPVPTKRLNEKLPAFKLPAPKLQAKPRSQSR